MWVKVFENVRVVKKSDLWPWLRCGAHGGFGTACRILLIGHKSGPVRLLTVRATVQSLLPDSTYELCAKFTSLCLFSARPLAQFHQGPVAGGAIPRHKQ